MKINLRDQKHFLYIKQIDVIKNKIDFLLDYNKSETIDII